MEDSDSVIRSGTFHTAGAKHWSPGPSWVTQRLQRSMWADSATRLCSRLTGTLLHGYCVITSTESETQQISQTVVTAGRPRRHHSGSSQNPWRVTNFTTQGYVPSKKKEIKRFALLLLQRRRGNPGVRRPKISPVDINPVLRQSRWPFVSLINVSAAWN